LIDTLDAASAIALRQCGSVYRISWRSVNQSAPDAAQDEEEGIPRHTTSY